jgi:hypothetical protein
MLPVKPKQVQKDVHFYMGEKYVEQLDSLCKQHSVGRGRILEALIDFYVQENKSET